MTIHAIYRTRAAASVLAGLVLSWSGAQASGSINLGGGGAAQESYHLGKAIFFEQLACANCPLKGGAPTAEQAPGVLKQLRSSELGAELSADERAAVETYLQRRYKLQ